MYCKSSASCFIERHERFHKDWIYSYKMYRPTPKINREATNKGSHAA